MWLLKQSADRNIYFSVFLEAHCNWEHMHIKQTTHTHAHTWGNSSIQEFCDLSLHFDNTIILVCRCQRFLIWTTLLIWTLWKWMKLYCVQKILFVTFMSYLKNLSIKSAGARVKLIRLERSRNKWWKVTFILVMGWDWRKK